MVANSASNARTPRFDRFQARSGRARTSRSDCYLTSQYAAAKVARIESVRRVLPQFVTIRSARSTSSTCHPALIFASWRFLDGAPVRVRLIVITSPFAGPSVMVGADQAQVGHDAISEGESPRVARGRIRCSQVRPSIQAGSATLSALRRLRQGCPASPPVAKLQSATGRFRPLDDCSWFRPPVCTGSPFHDRRRSTTVSRLTSTKIGR